MLIVSQQVKNVRSGVGTYARLLLQALDLRPTVATWTSEIDPSLPAEWIDLGERPRFDPTPGAFWTLGRRVARAVTRAFETVHFLDAREAHAWQGPGRLIGTVHDDYAAHAPRRPWGLVGRAADPLRRWAYYRWLERLERRTYARFNLLLANSRATASTLQDHYGAAHVQLIHLCVGNAPESAGERVELAGDPALLFVGGNFYRKGLDVLLRALPLVPGAHLHVAGHDRARMPDSPQVTYHGRVSPARVAQLMTSADQFVMPSRREALGLVYLEAARAGIPVIAGDRGGVRDIVKHLQSGLLVPIEDPEALAGAILLLQSDPALCDSLVRAARVELRARTPERLVKETLEAYWMVAQCA
jgi:glycosyltransferase involved in cell wall biosynthesis